jgi:hypothetical protein
LFVSQVRVGLQQVTEQIHGVVPTAVLVAGVVVVMAVTS